MVQYFLINEVSLDRSFADTWTVRKSNKLILDKIKPDLSLEAKEVAELGALHEKAGFS